ncbi:TetR/AcrR family transcriptional regulator [Kutzneria buriramensis]|uniref:Regulatory TetR family protein n=1 Tax=Kutzneria buriramensis TaxID=1045776 RepID=A0A3E0HKR2_9PSEU|nr:TetR/AcrR family transcriptional regulator [Kutzneria buriramensis]REH46930.1 regulatory TetR family protein [Kutzneria buriramensis]
MPRETLTREQIVSAAVEVLDTEGLEGLNMRALGKRLNCAATAVYWHVQSKDNLVVLAGDEVWSEIELPDLGVVDWRTAATTMAHGLHAMINRHLWLVPAMSTHLIYGPRKARHDDHCLRLYETAGFSGRDADWALNTVFMFVLGRALGESAELAWQRRLRRSSADEQQQMHESMEKITEIAMQFPRMRARMADWDDEGEAPADNGFEYGLQTILDGLAVRLAGGGTPVGPAAHTAGAAHDA